MIRLAVDSDNLSDLAVPVEFIITYSDLVTDPEAWEAEHTGRQCLYIDRGTGDPGNKASIIDVEFHAYTVADLAAWYDRKAAAKIPYLTWYASRNTIAPIQAVIGGRHMWRWVATLDGTVAIAGFPVWESPDLVQILGAPQLGVHVDLSLVLSPSWHPAPMDPKLAAAEVALQDGARGIVAAGDKLHTVMTLLRAL